MFEAHDNARAGVIKIISAPTSAFASVCLLCWALLAGSLLFVRKIMSLARRAGWALDGRNLVWWAAVATSLVAVGLVTCLALPTRIAVTLAGICWLAVSCGCTLCRLIVDADIRGKCARFALTLIVCRIIRTAGTRDTLVAVWRRFHASVA
jgi:hypothetical protein